MRAYRITRDVTAEAYELLLAEALKEATTFSLVWRDQLQFTPSANIRLGPGRTECRFVARCPSAVAVGEVGLSAEAERRNEGHDRRNREERYARRFRRRQGWNWLRSALAITISWSANKSILWAIIHGFLSWIYVIYYALKHR